MGDKGGAAGGDGVRLLVAAFVLLFCRAIFADRSELLCVVLGGEAGELRCFGDGRKDV